MSREGCAVGEEICKNKEYKYKLCYDVKGTVVSYRELLVVWYLRLC